MRSHNVGIKKSHLLNSWDFSFNISGRESPQCSHIKINNLTLLLRNAFIKSFMWNVVVNSMYQVCLNKLKKYNVAQTVNFSSMQANDTIDICYDVANNHRFMIVYHVFSTFVKFVESHMKSRNPFG